MSRPLDILVIDDEPGMRQMAVFALSDHGCRVETAANGKEGLEKVRAGKFDIVVCDLMMPGENGLNVLKAIKQVKPGLPVIMATGFAKEEDVEEGRQSGAFAFVAKPYGVDELRGLFDQALQAPAAAPKSAAPGPQEGAAVPAKPSASGMAAHEARNSLGILRMGLECLQREAKETSTQEMLVSMERALDRLDYVVTAMALFSEDVGLRPRAVPLRDVLGQALDAFRPQLKAQQITIDEQYQADLPSLVMDRDKISMALGHLLRNAQQAMPGGGTITVRAIVESQQKPHAVVEVIDTGSGMSPEAVKKAFEPFFSGWPEERGTGLGLTLAQRVAQLHQGAVVVENRPAGGVRAVLRLPIP